MPDRIQQVAMDRLRQQSDAALDALVEVASRMAGADDGFLTEDEQELLQHVAEAGAEEGPAASALGGAVAEVGE